MERKVIPIKQNISKDACDRFNTCSANICPLDPNWEKRKHLGEDRVCFYLIEAQKDGAKANFESGGKGNLYALMVLATPSIMAKHSNIKHTLERAKQTGSRLFKPFGGVHYEQQQLAA